MFSLKEKLKEQLAFNSEVKIIRIIDKLLSRAVNLDAVEIIFESQKNGLEVIFRLIAGTESAFLISKKIEAALISRLKEMAGINSPADMVGKFKKVYPGFKIIFLLSVHPTSAGEKITIDLQKEKFELLDIGRLGFNAPALLAVKNNLSRGSGLTLVVGNFNSGRTTTLYSFLKLINKPELNMATVESDISFDLPQVNQSQLDPISGFSASVAINSLRRQDADVAMIGEINDKETAETALYLAESGRFVLGGLYSQDARTALAFFRDLSISLQSFSSAVKMVISQRLLRKNCPHCLVEQKISDSTKKKLAEKFSLNSLLQRMRADKVISEKNSESKDLVFYKSRGCACCGQTGFLGRIGNFEVLEITPEVKQIIKEGHFSKIQMEVKNQGGYLLEEDALMKALAGVVPIEEVFRGME